MRASRCSPPPDDVHHGRARQRIEQRRRALGRAWGRHPERFVRGRPKPRTLPETVWINPPKATPTVGDAQYMTTLAVSTALTGSGRRIPDRATMLRETAAWVERRNAAGGTVDWRFTTADARVKLKSLYPSIQCPYY